MCFILLHDTVAMRGWKNLIAVWLGVVGVWLLIIQIDALSGHQPRFGIWAKDYVSDTKLLNDRNTTGIIPSHDEISKSPAMVYNYATMLALHWERVGLPEAVTYWEQSIEQYESILAQEENSFAQTNREILQNLMDEDNQEQEQEQQQNQQEQQEQSASWEEWSEDQGTQDWSQSPTEEWSQQDQQNWQPSWEEQWTQGEEPQESWLSQEQLQQLQDYQQQLQQQQFQNQQYFGKQPQNQQPSSVFDQFFWDPQFRQDQSGDEKDW